MLAHRPARLSIKPQTLSNRIFRQTVKPISSEWPMAKICDYGAGPNRIGGGHRKFVFLWGLVGKRRDMLVYTKPPPSLLQYNRDSKHDEISWTEPYSAAKASLQCFLPRSFYIHRDYQRSSSRYSPPTSSIFTRGKSSPSSAQTIGKLPPLPLSTRNSIYFWCWDWSAHYPPLLSANLRCFIQLSSASAMPPSPPMLHWLTASREVCYQVTQSAKRDARRLPFPSHFTTSNLSAHYTISIIKQQIQVISVNTPQWIIRAWVESWGIGLTDNKLAVSQIQK